MSAMVTGPIKIYKVIFDFLKARSKSKHMVPDRKQHN